MNSLRQSVFTSRKGFLKSIFIKDVDVALPV